jgi:hypothetical protein
MIEALFICLSIILGYSTFNLMRKVESLTDQLMELEDDLLKQRSIISNAIKEMRLVDSKGAFESSDEVGTVFDALKEIVYELEPDNDEKA